MQYIVKISPEITIKSKPVRKRCIRMLDKNIRRHFKFEGISGSIQLTWDSIKVRISNKEDHKRAEQVLQDIPGIAYFVQVSSYKLAEGASNQEIFEMVSDKAKQYFADKIEDKTFVVRVKRVGRHNFTSIEMERFVGSNLLQNAQNTKVQLKNPNIIVQLELRDQVLNIIHKKTEATGGYPIGFQEKVLSLVSGGFDSMVSSYLLMKRGSRVDYLFFNLGGNAHELGVKQVSYYLWKRFSLAHKDARFLTIPFEKIIAALMKHIDSRFRGIILKRYMLKVASEVSIGHYEAIIKGDSLGQVSSQTLKNLHVIDKASSTLVFRPLIGYNKQEIINISSRIGTYDFSANMPEYCGVVSDKPATGATEDQILEQESKLPDNLITEVLLGIQREFVKKMLDQYDDKNSGAFHIETSSKIGANECVIDIRDDDKKRTNPLDIRGIDLIELPFFELNHKFKDLNQEKTYLLYCDKGVLSRLHALYLRENGFKNIKVFRVK